MSNPPPYIHGELVATHAYCDVCEGLQPVAHFEAEAFIEAHPFAARGISSRDLKEWQRGWGADGRSSHRALRLQLDRRSRNTRALALAKITPDQGWDEDVEKELKQRANVLDTVAKGVLTPRLP